MESNSHENKEEVCIKSKEAKLYEISQKLSCEDNDTLSGSFGAECFKKLPLDNTTDTTSSSSIKKEAPILTQQQERKVIKKRRVISCSICLARFLLRSKLEEHMLSHREGDKFKCNFCPKVFAHKGNLRRHLVTHEKQNTLTCEMCNTSTVTTTTCNTQKSYFNKHMVTYTSQCWFSCKICQNKCLTVESNVLMSLHSHLICHVCLDTCDQKNVLDGPKFIYTNGSGQMAVDSKYDLYFNNSFMYNNNQMLVYNVNTGQKVYQCDICQISFKWKQSLKKHKLIHTGQSIEFQCNVCNAMFTTKHSLNKHKRIHLINQTDFSGF